MSAWILSIEGTPDAALAAMVLALVAALAHAILGAMQKGRHDPWLSRGVIDIAASLISIPLAIWAVPLPSWELVQLFPLMMLIHLAYKWVLAMAYSRGAFTAVYPIVRGTGPLATVMIAGIVFGEHFAPGQWAGVALLSGGIFALAAANLAVERIDPSRLRLALALAVLTGLIVALYTVYDAYLIRLAEDPFTFIVWFFMLEGVLFPLLLWRRWARAPGLPGLFLRGTVGAVIAYVSFGSVFLATRLDKVGEAAALRETSVIFAALIGWFFLGERIGRVRAALMIVIALGAVLVEFG
ncbi:MAG: EamA family transporter [Pseudomonadota bacterium]